MVDNLFWNSADSGCNNRRFAGQRFQNGSGKSVSASSMDVEIGRAIKFSDASVLLQERNEPNLGISDFFARRCFADCEKNARTRRASFGQRAIAPRNVW
jgi:hypothetical protein